MAESSAEDLVCPPVMQLDKNSEGRKDIPGEKMAVFFAHSLQKLTFIDNAQ